MKEPGDRITVMHLIGSLKIGGAEQQLVSIAPLFDPEAFKVIVCTMQPGGMLWDQLAARDVDMRTLDFRTRSAPLAILKLCRLLKRERVDVLHMHMYAAALYGRIAGILAGVPVMITTDHGKGMWKKPHQIALERRLVRRTSMRIGVSQDIANIIGKREGVPEEKLMVLSNGVDMERFRFDRSRRDAARNELGFTDDQFVIGTLARLVEPKALHVMIEALSLLVEKRPQARLLVVGDGPLKGALEANARDFGVADRVLFTGARSDIPALLFAMDLFALSSIREGLPVSLLEAMASAKPIVATRVGGIPETVRDHEEALLVESNDPGALAGAFCEMIDHPELAVRLGANALGRVGANYSAAATTRRLEATYRSLLEGEVIKGDG